jgi:hypothetical protein
MLRRGVRLTQKRQSRGSEEGAEVGSDDRRGGAGGPPKDTAPMIDPKSPATAGLQAMLQVEPSACDAKL